MSGPKWRLAVVVSHPIQYLVPLYRRLASRDDIALKVFFTWHAGEREVYDRGFQRTFQWDIPLTEGYDWEVVRNIASNAGSHHFWGLNNPMLVGRVEAWQPDVVHVTGWASYSHLQALRGFRKHGIRILFRGDSHLLDANASGPRWWLKKAMLRRIYAWPRAFLYVGAANRVYFERFGVGADRLFYCPHSIEMVRFADPDGTVEAQALRWRRELHIRDDAIVILFAGKFEPKKCPIELMRAFLSATPGNAVLVMVGNGELEPEIVRLAAENPGRIRVLPFQNQSQMPLVYRLGDLFVLPSAYRETWGLAVNEALASERPVLVSNRVGCAADVVDGGCGRVFQTSPPAEFPKILREMTSDRNALVAMRVAARQRATAFDISATEEGLIRCLEICCANA